MNALSLYVALLTQPEPCHAHRGTDSRNHSGASMTEPIPFRPRDPSPAVHEKWNELRRAYGPPARVVEDNPYPFNTEEWRIWQQGADATNNKWMTALLGRMPTSASPRSHASHEASVPCLRPSGFDRLSRETGNG